MRKTFWSALHEELYQPLERLTPVPKPTDADLDSFEAKLQICLPASYRSFITLFGPGSLTDYSMILSPNCAGNSHFDMDTFNRKFRNTLLTPPFNQAYYKDIALVKRLIFFGATPNNDYFGWDADETLDKSAEPRVHFLPRLATETQIVASSFRDFIEHWLTSTATRAFIPAGITPQGRRKLEGTKPAQKKNPSNRRSKPEKPPDE